MLAFKARKRGVTATSTTAAILDFSQTTPFWAAVCHCRLGAGLAAKEDRCISDLTCRRDNSSLQLQDKLSLDSYLSFKPKMMASKCGLLLKEKVCFDISIILMKDCMKMCDFIDGLLECMC